MRGPRALAILAITVLTGLILAPPAAAADPIPAAGVVVDQGDGQVRQAIRIARIYPTASRQVVIFVKEDDADPARRVQVGVSQLADHENGCNHPEVGTGDPTCGDGPDQGELSRYLEVRLAAGRTGVTGSRRTCTPAAAAASTTLATLRATPVIVGLPDRDGALCVVATFTHVNSATDNLTQSDTVDFDLRLRFDSETVSDSGHGGAGVGEHAAGGAAGGGAQVDAAGVGQPVVVGDVGSGRVVLDGLPRTGLPVTTLMIGGLGLLGVGTLAIAAGRRRPRQTLGVSP